MAGPIIATVLAIVFALSASAQRREITTESIESLHHASDVMRDAEQFFRRESATKMFPDAPASKNRVPLHEQDFADNFNKMKAATDLFLRFASEPFISRAIESIGHVFESSGLPKPATIESAIEQCDRQRSTDLSASVATSLSVSFYHAWQGQAADAKFGPIIDNPTFYAVVRPPTSGMELLRNAKWALDHDALLRVDFFTSENMKRFFGATAPVIRTLEDILVRWEVKPSAAALAALPPNAAESARCIYIVQGSLQADGNLKSANLDFNCDYSPNREYPTFDEVVEVFGHRWRSAWEVNGPRLHGMPPTPTAPHGNEDMIYEFPGAPYRGHHVWRRLLVRFAPDATFENFSLYEGF
jgi:hypothetical protein